MAQRQLPSAPPSTGRRLKRSWLLCLSLLSGIWAGLPAQAQQREVGSKGAQIYCFMRNNGNNHQVSWDAAYAVIKRQSNDLFKTSPQHAAVMITEAVVQNPAEFPDCGRYLGDLFRQPETTAPTRSAEPAGGTTRSERFGT